MLNKAIEFATYYHRNQFRKYTGEPYIIHPAKVAQIVTTVPHTEAMLCAAWLHDTVEDTEATLVQIEEQFNGEIAILVEMLTDVSTKEDGNREARKEIDRLHTAKASKDAKTIKLADLINNTESIVKYDKHFAESYLREKELLLDVLTDGNPKLFIKAWKQTNDGFFELYLHKRYSRWI